MRRLAALFPALGLALLVGGCTNAQSPPAVEGYGLDAVAVAEWDTVFEVRSSAEDTTLLLPTQVVAWAGGTVVGDAIGRTITFFDAAGEVQWVAGRSGEGPSEFEAIVDMYVGPDSLLWVLDASNVRMATVSTSGEILETHQLGGVPVFPWSALDLGDSLLILAGHRERAVSQVSKTDYHTVSARPLHWPAGIPPRGPSSARGAVEPNGSRWAAGMQLGPGFVIGEGGRTKAFHFAEPVPFATGRARERAVHGATAAHAASEGVYFLFGGRPVRVEDPQGDPARRIDLYSWEGEFQRRYLLPLGILDFSKVGDLFYVVGVDPEPTLMALRPRP